MFVYRINRTGVAPRPAGTELSHVPAIPAADGKLWITNIETLSAIT
jgi:hypothetical protein